MLIRAYFMVATAAAGTDSQEAAKDAPTAPNGTNGATHFFLNCDCTPKPAWYSQCEIEESLGPFESRRIARGKSMKQASDGVCEEH